MVRVRVRLRGLEEGELGWGMKPLGVVGGKDVPGGYDLDRRGSGGHREAERGGAEDLR